MIIMPNMMPALISAVTVTSSRGAHECESDIAEAVLRILKKESLSGTEVADRMQMPKPKVMAHITYLMKEGYVKKNSDGIYVYVKR